MERVLCPLCELNITLFNLRQRDEHVNMCLESPGVLEYPYKPANKPVPNQPIESESSATCGAKPRSVQQLQETPLSITKEVRKSFTNTKFGEKSEGTLLEPSGSGHQLMSQPCSETQPKQFPGHTGHVPSCIVKSPCNTAEVKAEPDQVGPPSFHQYSSNSAKPDPVLPPLKRSGSQIKFTTAEEIVKAEENIAKRVKRVRKVPYFKILTFGNVRLAVDGFLYGDLKVDGYFLTHFHSDHYGGLSKNWSHGQIYCTPPTARLVAMKLRVNPERLESIEVGQEYTIHGQSVRVLDANHCPGAAIFLFNNRVLHTGDFRASEEVLASVLEYTGSLSTLYLDTTYLDPGRTFPIQNVVVDICSELCCQEQARKPKRSFFTASRPNRILVLVGTYTIGKERLAVGIARALESKIWASTPEKKRVLVQLGDTELDELMEHENGLNCQVHLVNMRDLAIQKLERQWDFLRKHYTELLAFSPTGWTHSNRTAFSLQSIQTNAITRPGIRVFRVPYSEHSSFSELERFCRGIPCDKIIPTVSTKNSEILREWERGYVSMRSSQKKLSAITPAD